MCQAPLLLCSPLPRRGEGLGVRVGMRGELVRSLREEVADLRPEGFWVRNEEALRQQSLEEF